MYYRHYIPRYHYPYRRWYDCMPYRYCYRPYYMPYNNFIGSNFSYTDQNLYNSGIMNDIIQESIISQTSPDEDGPVLAQEPTPPPQPEPIPEPVPIPPPPEPIPPNTPMPHPRVKSTQPVQELDTIDMIESTPSVFTEENVSFISTASISNSLEGG